MQPRRQQAQALVEFALASTVLLWFALGTLDFGRIFYTYIELTNAAREGARYATLHPTVCDVAPIRTFLVAQQPQIFTAANVSTVTLEAPCPQPLTDPPDRRTVTITSYPFEPVTPFIANALGNGTVIPLTTSATMPVVNQ